MRKFNIINESGQKFSLMDIENFCFLTNPEGLGLKYDRTYSRIGTTFVTETDEIAQSKISGILNFKNYTNFNNFVNFISAAKSLKLEYIIKIEDAEKAFYRDFEIESISKEEIKKCNISSDVVFAAKSLWYEEKTVQYTIEPTESEIRWDFRWDSKFVDYNSRSLQFVNNGHIEAPIEVEISGHVINPQIELYIDGQLYQTVPFSVEIQEHEKILYGTKENNFYIKKQNVDGTYESLFNLDVIDFANDNVIRLPKNRSCELRLEADNEILNAQITIYPQYKAV